MLMYFYVHSAFFTLKSYYLPRSPNFSKSLQAVASLTAALAALAIIVESRCFLGAYREIVPYMCYFFLSVASLIAALAAARTIVEPRCFQYAYIEFVLCVFVRRIGVRPARLAKCRRRRKSLKPSSFCLGTYQLP